MKKGTKMVLQLMDMLHKLRLRSKKVKALDAALFTVGRDIDDG